MSDSSTLARHQCLDATRHEGVVIMPPLQTRALRMQERADHADGSRAKKTIGDG